MGRPRRGQIKAHRGGEDGEGGGALHGPGGVVQGGVDEADEGEPLAHLQRVAHEQHPLPTQLLQHRRGVEPAFTDGKRPAEFGPI